MFLSLKIYKNEYFFDKFLNFLDFFKKTLKNINKTKFSKNNIDNTNINNVVFIKNITKTKFYQYRIQI